MTSYAQMQLHTLRRTLKNCRTDGDVQTIIDSINGECDEVNRMFQEISEALSSGVSMDRELAESLLKLSVMRNHLNLLLENAAKRHANLTRIACR